MSIKSKRAELLSSPWAQFLDFSSNVEEEILRNQNIQKLIDQMMPIVAYLENGHFVAVATCSTPGCGKESRWTCGGVPRNPGVVFTKFRNREWQASKKKLTCPTCVKRSKQKPVVEFKRESVAAPVPPKNQIFHALEAAVEERHVPLIPGPVTGDPIPHPTFAEGETTVPEVTAPTATDKARAAKRAAYALLLDHYDDKNKRYNGDWSDKKIAAAVQMSEAFVAKIREDDFGPAGPPPQFIDLKQRITAMETKLSQRETQVLQAMEMLPELQKELGLLKDQLTSLVNAHGWSE